MVMRYQVFLLSCMFSTVCAMDQETIQEVPIISVRMDNKKDLLCLALVKKDGHFIARILKELGAIDPFDENERGFSLVEKATTYETLKPLIEHYDDPNKYNQLFIHLMRIEKDNIFSFFADEQGKPTQERAKCLEWLLQQGCDPNQEIDGLTPLCILLQRASDRADDTRKEIRTIISHGADPDKKCGKTHRSACEYAAQRKLARYSSLMKEAREWYEKFLHE